MPTRFGADGGFASTTSGGVFDSSGNPIVSADNEFGAAPLGPAALAQTLFSVPNGTFNILPPDIDIPISNENPLPYWSSPVDNSDGEMIAQVVYNTTSNTYSLRMDPGSALSGDTLSITTRSAVLSDDNLSLRQKAIATLEKVGTYAGTTQVNLKLDATYYDHTGTQLSTNPIGTVFDNGTVSSFAEFTTAGTAIVGVSAAYVDLTFTMTATANVTSGIAFDIDTILLQTSQGAGGGGQSFLITEKFTSSGTWTKPTGVDYLVAIVAVGGGGGGSGGNGRKGLSNNYVAPAGGVGGGSSRWVYVRDVNVENVSTITIGIGAGGAGGAGGTVIKTAAEATGDNYLGALGGAGGTTTVGTYITVLGGGAGGTAAGVPTTTLFGGFAGTLPSTAGTNNANGTSSATTYTTLPYTSVITSTGTNGGSATINAGTGVNDVGNIGTAGASGYLGSGGGGGSAQIGGGTTSNSGWNGGLGAGGGGAGGVERVFGVSGTAAVSITGSAGNGGYAVANSGAAGGGGGAIGIYGGTASGAGGSAQYRASSGTLYAGTGAEGASGVVFIAYIG